MLVIDFEVFKYDWLCVIHDLNEKQEIVIVNDRQKLVDLYEKHKNDLFIGFNIRHYDQYIFKAVLLDFNPKEVSDYIIVQGQNGWRFSRDFNRIPLCFFDIMPSLSGGLKTLEGFMGSDIRESTVSFDIDRKLTVAELSEVIQYCRHDVQQTCEILNINIAELTSQIEVVKMFDLPRVAMGKTKPALSAMVLGAEKRNWNDELNFTIPDTLKIKKYQFIVDWFKERIGSNLDLHEFYKQNLEVNVAGVPHVFAWGGIHGAIANYCEEGYFINIDVASYYPSLMIEYDYISRNIKNKEYYKDIYHKRLAYKAAKDKRAEPLKIVLNSTYGAMKDLYNPLYDPKNANNVCVAGQLLLLDLIEHLEDRFDIIQSNTDGILVKLRAETEHEANREYVILDDRCHEWERRTRMVLEFEEFKKVIQRDVNNYIIVANDNSYKSKGGVVKKLNNLDYDLPIVNKAIVSNLVMGIPISETINNCNDLREFQKIVRVSRLYKYAIHNDKQLSEKTFRVFASKKDTDGMIYKVKNEQKNPEKFANTPSRCFVDNSAVKGVAVPEHLDKDWYIELANKRVNEFLGR